MKTFAILVMILLAIQAVLTYRQLKNFKMNADQLRRIGRTGVGNEKKSFGAGAIVILAADPNEIVVDGRIMQGVSVFAKCESFTKYNGSKLSHIIEELEAKLPSGKANEHAEMSATIKAAKMLYDSFRAERGEDKSGKNKSKQKQEFDLSEENVVEVEESQVVSKTVDDYEAIVEYNREDEAEIIDVEEIKS